MRMNGFKKRRLIITLIILAVLACTFFYLGFKKSSSVKYSYKEDNSVDYKVYLKANSFFETPYLEKNKTYITSLIDYIDTDFKYSITFNKEVSGKIKYQLMAEIKADKNNNDVGNYWTKTYSLTEEKTEDIKHIKTYNANIEQKIDYNSYNELMTSFIKEYGLQAEATLKIYLKVNGHAKVEGKNEEMSIDSKINLTVPLSKLAIEGKIETQNNNNEKEIVRNYVSNEPINKFYKVLFVIVILMLTHTLLQYVVFLVNKNKHLNYRDTIKKINNDYDDIITKVKNINTEKFSVIDVESFEDLISIYNSVREPINFLYGNDRSKYFIIKGKACYMFTVNKEG